jgi:prepilin-type processing-associated H-X9-DG protein
MALTEEEADKRYLKEYKRLFGKVIKIGEDSLNPIQKTDAIRELYKGKYHTCDGWGNVVWLDGHETTEEEKKKIDDRFVEMYLEWRDYQYQRDRADSYPSVIEQLEYIGDHGIDAWQEDLIKPVKEKFPKNG